MRPDFFEGRFPPRAPGFLVGVRNRATTLLNWFWSYLTFSGGIRLITGSDRAPDRP
jgi:hypothetical protein